jgi:hypothetical protein
MRVTLDEADFRDLVAGRAVNHGWVEISLDYIEWRRLVEALADAMRDRGVNIEVMIRTRRPVIEDSDSDE